MAENVSDHIEAFKRLRRELSELNLLSVGSEVFEDALEGHLPLYLPVEGKEVHMLSISPSRALENLRSGARGTLWWSYRSNGVVAQVIEGKSTFAQQTQTLGLEMGLRKMPWSALRNPRRLAELHFGLQLLESHFEPSAAFQKYPESQSNHQYLWRAERMDAVFEYFFGTPKTS